MTSDQLDYVASWRETYASEVLQVEGSMTACRTAPSVPVLFRRGAEPWPATRLWTYSYLRDRIGRLPVDHFPHFDPFTPGGLEQPEHTTYGAYL